MPGHKPRTNKALLFFAVILCILTGGAFTRSSASSPPFSQGIGQDMYVAENPENPFRDPKDGEAEAPPQAEPSPTATPTPRPQPTLEASQEAAAGVWTPSKSSWYFMVNGLALTGWLTDTDGRRYFFDANGIMQTGWLEDQGERYYLNSDGIMQTGDVSIEGKVYRFRQDGVLEGEVSSSEEDSKEPLLFYIPDFSSPDALPGAGEEPEDLTSPAPEAAGSEAQTAEGNEAETEADSGAQAEADNGAQAEADSGAQAAKARKKVALTFDDGPSDFTDRLLDCLEANQAKATFFLVGKEVEYFQEPVRRMEALGCEIGNHSYDHTDLTSLSPEEISSQIGRTDQLILELTGHGGTVVRPPYGSVNETVSSVIATPMILWSIDPEDWVENADPQKIVQSVMEQVTEGSVILMHDIFSTSVDAAELLIPRLIQEGYDLVTIHELAAFYGTDLTEEGIFSSFSPAPAA